MNTRTRPDRTFFIPFIHWLPLSKTGVTHRIFIYTAVAVGIVFTMVFHNLPEYLKFG